MTNQKFSSLEWRKTIIDARLQKRLEEQDVRGMLPELRAAIADLQERAAPTKRVGRERSEAHVTEPEPAAAEGAACMRSSNRRHGC